MTFQPYNTSSTIPIPVILHAMRLLYEDRTSVLDTQCKLKSYSGDRLPCYGILSHVWGHASEELTYQDIPVHESSYQYRHAKYGARKLEFCLKRLEEDGLKYVWIDTCCIDKSNSVELHEALNSMYRWYENSTVCYVYLPDVTYYNPITSEEHPWEIAFRKSRWFTRGWTLQELLAPSKVEFYSTDGVYLGNKKTLEALLHDITKIPVAALRGAPLSRFTVEERMSWGSERDTSRPEDKAYCMMGVCEVFLPWIYGWGEQYAVAKLHQEVQQSKTNTNFDPESVVRIGGASYYDLLALNDEDATELERQLLELLSWISRQSLMGRARYVSVCRETTVHLRSIFDGSRVSYIDSSRLRQVWTDDTGLETYQRAADRETDEIRAATTNLEHMRGCVAVTTCVMVLAWRGKWKAVGTGLERSGTL